MTVAIPRDPIIRNRLLIFRPMGDDMELVDYLDYH